MAWGKDRSAHPAVARDGLGPCECSVLPGQGGHWDGQFPLPATRGSCAASTETLGAVLQGWGVPPGSGALGRLPLRGSLPAPLAPTPSPTKAVSASEYTFCIRRGAIPQQQGGLVTLALG